ncbi:MAG: hypothetical protein M3071_23305 [Actinomycetota bacterium]|nr:hypothetical protein [Actinomycetota bacterium]
MHDDHVSRLAEPAPFDLHAPQLAADVQREVGPAMLGHRLQYRDAQLRRGEQDRRLGDRALAVAVA